MNDDDLRTAMWIAACCLVGSLLLIVLVMLSTPARAAALLTLDGQRIVVMTADELLQVVRGKDEEIARLQSRLDERRRVDCPLI